MESKEITRSEDLAPDINALTRQHLKRFRFRCQRYTITLKFMTKMDRDATVRGIIAGEMEIARKKNLLWNGSPFQKACKHIEYLRDIIAQYPEGGCPQEYLNQMDEARILLAPSMRLFALNVFDNPRLTSIDQLDALLNDLTDDEYNRITPIMTILGSLKPEIQIESEVLRVCSKFGIKMEESLTVDNMTIMQWSLISEAEMNSGGP